MKEFSVDVLVGTGFAPNPMPVQPPILLTLEDLDFLRSFETNLWLFSQEDHTVYFEPPSRTSISINRVYRSNLNVNNPTGFYLNFESKGYVSYILWNEFSKLNKD